MTKLNWDRVRVERLIRKAGTIHFSLDTPPLFSDEPFAAGPSKSRTRIAARPSESRTRITADTSEIRELRTFLLEFFGRQLSKVEASAIVDLFSSDDLFVLNRSIYEAAENMSLWVARTPIADVKAHFDKVSHDEKIIVTLIMKRGIRQANKETKAYKSLIRNIERKRMLNERKRAKKLKTPRKG